MTSRLWIFALLAGLAACNANSKDNSGKPLEGPDAPKDTKPATAAVSPMLEKLRGYWVGIFKPSKAAADVVDNKINVAITDVVGDSVKGYSVVAGNRRPFAGTMKKEGDVIKLNLTEPGDDKYDGTFSCALMSDALMGDWKPLHPEKYNVNRQYILSKKEFKYDPSVGQYPEASKRALKTSDVENMYKNELRIMRNEMYARHGYSFKMRDMRTYFDAQEWYIPLTTDVRVVLTDLEKKNEALIKKYEKYAEEYYDEYGR